MAAAGVLAVLLVIGVFADAAAQPRPASQGKPEGEMRWALYVTLSPVWFDPGEFAGLTPFWVLYAIHDALVPRTFEFALPIEPYPYDPAKAKQLLAEAGYPNGFDAGELHQAPPYFSMGETIMSYLGAVGIKLKMRSTERAAYISALLAKKLRGVCVCANAIYGNAASRMSEHVPSTGAYAYGGYPDIDALFKEQALVTDRRKREALLHQIQQLVHERVRFGPIWESSGRAGWAPASRSPR